MEVPIQVKFRNMDHAPEIEADVRGKIAKLEEFFDRIVSCHVTVEAPHHHHRQGNTYQVRIILTVPNREIVVNRDPGLNRAHEDVLVAIRDAFDDARRQLEDYVREMRGAIKQHRPSLQGRIARLFTDYGFIKADDGHEAFFHRNVVVEIPYDELEEGIEVRFQEEEAPEGPRATSVVVINRHPAVTE